jgi:DNA-3-methyladenine glycosylase II
MTATDYVRATRLLSRRDPVIRTLVQKYGPCRMASHQHTEPFQALVHAIISQQLSTKAAATIAARFTSLFPGGFPTPARVAATPDATLRGVGLSGQKLGYLRDLCQRIQSGALPLDAIEAMPDAEVIAALTQVKGIGTWTAEMFLMFRLHRPDVLPVGDLGIVKAIQQQYRLRKTPKPERLLEIGEAWRPYRSVACWYLWRSLENTPMKD